jgi:hypothetical protein
MVGLAKIIDVHSDPILPFGQGAPAGPGQKQPEWSVESALSYMEEHDIAAPVSPLVMGLDFALMPKSTFAPAITDIGRYPAVNTADLQSLSYDNAGRLYPALKARMEQNSEHQGSRSTSRVEGARSLRLGSM